MKFTRRLALIPIAFLFACQSAIPSSVTVIDGVQTITFQTEERVPMAILTQAGIALSPNDRVIANGITISPELPITTYPLTIQLRRAGTVTLITPQGQQTLETSAFTVGEALQEAGTQLHANDKIDPPINTPITNSPITIHYSPANNLTITADGRTIQITSSARMM